VTCVEVTLDAFPANVTVDGTVWPKVRVIVADQRATVYGLVGGAPAVVAAAMLSTPVRHAGYPYSLELSEGGTWSVARASGCGCGHILKRLSRDALLALAG
jgi:hypothetical protein